jgi:hypothetical protein
MLHPMFPRPQVLTCRRRALRWARAARALFVAAGALIASAAGCGDDPAPPLTAAPDAGPACEQGSEGCACFFGSGCRDDLLCIAGRCLMTQGQGESDPAPGPRPPLTPNPPPPPVGGRIPDAGDAGGSPVDAGDGLDAASDGS